MKHLLHYFACLLALVSCQKNLEAPIPPPNLAVAKRIELIKEVASILKEVYKDPKALYFCKL